MSSSPSSPSPEQPNPSPRRRGRGPSYGYPSPPPADAQAGQGGPGTYGGGYGGYGNYGGGYGYGYGYGGQNQDAFQASLRHYLEVIQERKWYIITVFIAVLLGSLLFTLGVTKIYEASSSVRIFRREAAAMKVQQVVESEVRSTEDLNTEVKMLESSSLVQDVAAALTPAEKVQLMAPHRLKGEDPASAPSEEEVLRRLLKDRSIVPQRLSLVIMIQYRHPSPQLAARIANLFADQFITANSKQRVEESVRAGEDLTRRAEAQRKKVTELANELQKYREKNNMVSLDQRKDIVTERLKAISLNLTQLNAKLEEVRVRARELAAAQAAKTDLTSLPYIANDLSVRKLKEQLALLEVDKAKLLERYLPDHPKVQEIERSVTQTRSQIDIMVASAVKGVESEYTTLQQNVEQAKQALAAQEALSLELDRAAVAYAGVEREYKIAEQLLQNLISRIGEIAMTSAMQSQNARIVDVAKPPKESVFPKLSLNLGLGAVGGLFLGFAVAFLVAQLDDRVRSALDIEGHVGLPLLGVLPLTEEQNPAERAQLLTNKKNSLVIEGFSGLLASLSLREDFNQLKVLSVTSTIPGEGKSFISYGLATTFAARGERVCLIDCDLRKPTQHRLQGSDNLRGVLDLCEGRSTDIASVVHRNTAAQFDTIFAGGTSREASRALASKAAAAFLADLRKHYDRVIIDTPPVGVVSDVLALLQHCDGSVYVIKFGKAKRDLVRSCVARVGESVAPCIGAVLNALPFDGTGRYYQSAYYSAYDKEYGEYYNTKDERAKG